jgi:ankyrin repeat protein
LTAEQFGIFDELHGTWCARWLLHQSTNNRDVDAATAALIKMGKRSHGELCDFLGRRWKRNEDELVASKRRVLSILAQTGDRECVRAVETAISQHAELRGAGEQALRKMKGEEQRHTEQLVAARDVHTAAREGNLAAVQAILDEAPALVNADKEGEQPLHAALGSVEANPEVARLLIARGADVKAVNPNGITPLHLNSINGTREVAELLVAAGADVNAVNPDDGSVPLHLAALGGKDDLITGLLAKGANLAARDKKYGVTALHFAAANGHTSTIKLLFSHGADPAIKDDKGRTPMELARELRRSNSVAVLREYAEKDHPPTGQQQAQLDKDLFAAVKEGNAQTVTRLLHAGANPNAVGSRGDTPLHEAAKKDDLACCTALLDGKADPAARDDSNQTPLEAAVEFTLRGRMAMEAAFPGLGAMAAQVGNEKLTNLLSVFKKHGAPQPANVDAQTWNSVAGNSKVGCFIATACYGSSDCPEVLSLRRWRDERLAPRAWGRVLIEWYYRLSPPVAAVLRRSAALRAAVRRLLVSPLARWAGKGDK